MDIDFFQRVSYRLFRWVHCESTRLERAFTCGNIYCTAKLIIIPVYLFAASIAMVFSLSLFANLLGHRKQAIGKPMLQYAFIFILLHVGALGSSLVETFISNEALKAMLQSGIYFIMNIN